MKHHQQPSNIPKCVPFGREDIVRSIFDKLTGNPAQGPQGSALIGPPLMGKSKILDCITNPDAQRFYRLDTKAIFPVRISGASIPVDRKEAFKLFAEKAVKVVTEVWNFNDQDLQEELEKISRSESLVQIKAFLEEVLRVHTHDRSIIYVIDHFEKVLSLLTGEDIQYLRDIFSNYRQALVIAVPKPLIDLTPKTFPSSFHLIFKHVFVPPYSQEQAEQYLDDLFCDASNLLAGEKELVLRKTGYHPRFLEVYGSFIKDKKIQGISIFQNSQDIERLDHSVLDVLNVEFLGIWQEIDKDRQRVLSALATNVLVEADHIRSLQSLESEFGIIYRQDGHYHLMGELFKTFIVSQAQIINQFNNSDFYHAGITSLEQLKESEYWGTDPIIYYRQAFWEYTKENPDYVSSHEMSLQAFEQTMDVVIKRLEQRTKQITQAQTMLEKIDYITSSINLDAETSEFLKTYWKLLLKDVHGNNENDLLYQSILRFYVLSAIIQLLVNMPFQYTVLPNKKALGEQYIIIETIQETNHSVLYKAKHKLIPSRYVAIKTIKDEGLNESEVMKNQERLIREAVIVARLDHPNIGKVYHIVQDPFQVVMEWVDGDSLEKILNDTKNSLSYKEVIEIGIKLAEILEYSHGKGVIHRDIKPSNIILRTRGDPVLVDFDIARAANLGTISSGVDGKHHYLGTVEYSSPEQIQNPEGVTSSTDIFSLGMVLYKLICRDNPHLYGNSPAQYENGHLPKPPKKNIHDDLYAALLKCLAEVPTQRPDAKTLKTILFECLQYVQP